MEFIDIHVIETKYWTMQYKVQWNKLNSILRLKIYSEPLRLRSFFTTCWARQKFSTFLWAITQFEELHVYTCSCASFGLWEISIAWRTQFLSCFDHFQGKMGAIPFKIKKNRKYWKIKICLYSRDRVCENASTFNKIWILLLIFFFTPENLYFWHIVQFVFLFPYTCTILIYIVCQNKCQGLWISLIL